MAKNTSARPHVVTLKAGRVLNESPTGWCQDHASGDWLVVSHIARGPVQAEFADGEDAVRFRRVFVA